MRNNDNIIDNAIKLVFKRLEQWDTALINILYDDVDPYTFNIDPKDIEKKNN